MTRLEQQFAFLLEIDNEKAVTRQNYIPSANRRETDSDHAWHLAMMTLLLGEYAAQPIDMLRTLTMVLLHDLVEIDAGDTFAYDEQAVRGQHDREAAAANRIFGLLPPDQRDALRGIWEEFEARRTPEAQFARAIDRLQPIMLNYATDGRAWREHGVRLEQILRRNAETGKAAPSLWDYAQTHFIEPGLQKGFIRDDGHKPGHND